MKMTTQTNSTSISLSAKIFLLLVAGTFALAVVILIISSSTAATATGAAPSLAISLTGEMGTGILAPGEQRWYKYTPASKGQIGHVEQSLTLFFAPGDDNRVRQVSLQLFEAPPLGQVDSGSMANFGAGQLVSRDNNPRSGELFWNGWLFGQQNYYIQLVNSNEVPVDYWLLTDDVLSYPIDELEPPAESNPESGSTAFAVGASPQAAVPLQTGRNKGDLAPRQETWYSFSVTDTDEDYFDEMALTLFGTPNTANQIQGLTFEVFTAEEAERWALGGQTELNNVGVGSIEPRDQDPLTGERFWTGWVVDHTLYYVRVRNGTDYKMDYWLFTGDVYNPELGDSLN